jgi:hypothetical protein
VSEAVDDLALNRQTSISVGKGEAMSNISELAAKILERRRVLDRTFNDDLRRMRRRFGDHAVVLALAEMYRLQLERQTVAIAPKRQQERGPQFRFR